MSDFVHFAKQIEPMGVRLQHCFEQIGGVGEWHYRSTAAYRSAGLMLGVDAASVRHMVRKASSLGGLDGYLAWRAEFGFGDLRHFPLPEASVGYVYEASLEGYPNVVKIGFSRDPEKREQSLRRDTGVVHRIEAATLASAVCEHGEHFRRRGLRISREWFFRREEHGSKVPRFLLVGLDSVMARINLESCGGIAP